MLGLPLTAAIDIWSLGCLAATLYLGRQLYGGFTEYEMVSLQLLSTWVRFTRSARVTLVTTYRWGALWRHRASRWNAWCRSQNSRFLLQMSAVLLLLNIFTAIFFQVFPIKDEDKLDLALFVDLLIKMLHLEPGKRITPQQILKHRFLTSFLTPVKNHWSIKITVIAKFCVSEPQAAEST